MSHPRVLVIYNEPVLPADHPDAASEHDIVETARTITQVLTEAGLTARSICFSFDPRILLDEVRDNRPDVIFNLFEGLATQTATEIAVVSLLEWLNIPFTGSPSFAIAPGAIKFAPNICFREPDYRRLTFWSSNRLPFPSGLTSGPRLLNRLARIRALGSTRQV